MTSPAGIDTATDGGASAQRKAGVSLRTRFLVVCLMIFLGGAVASYGVIGWFGRDIVRTLGGWFAEKSVLYEKSKVLQLVLREVVLTQKMASSPLLRAWVGAETDVQIRAQAIAELEDYRKFYRSRSYFFAIAESGNYYFNDEKGGLDPHLPRYTLNPSIPKDGWFYETLKKVPDYQLNVDTDRHLKVTKVWINTVLRRDGKPVAVIGTGVDLSDFIKSVVSSTKPGVTNILLDHNGAIQAHHDVSVIDFASIAKEKRHENQSTIFNLIEGAAGRAAFQEALADLSAGKVDTRSLEVSIQGKRHIAGVTYIPDVKWFLLTLTRPEAAENQNYLKAVALVLIAALALTLLVAGLIFDRMVLRRLAALDAAARDMARGKYDVMLPRQGSDELSRLRQSFQELANRVAAHTSDLEQQVADRTQVLERQANADFLTGLLNRRGMIERIEIEKNRLARGGGRLGVVILDLDHFKSINDTYGHNCGDQVLIRTAAIIRGALRSYDACARWGGEEFLAVIPGIAGRDELAGAGDKLRLAIKAATIATDGGQVRITASMGCHLAQPDESLDQMLKAADDALYAAKQGGRDRVVVAGGGAT